MLSLVVVSLVVVLYRGQSSAPAEEFTAIQAQSQSLLDTSVFDTPLFPEFQDAKEDEAAAPVAQHGHHVSVELVTSTPRPGLAAEPATGGAAQPQQISIELVTPPPVADQEAGAAVGAQPAKPMQISIELSPPHASADASGAATGSLGESEPIETEMGSPYDLPLVNTFTSVPTLPVEAPKPTAPVLSPLTIPIQITTTKATGVPILAVPLTQAPVPENTSAPSVAPSKLDPRIAHYKKEEAHWKAEEAHWKRFEKHMMETHAQHAMKAKAGLPKTPPAKPSCDDCDMLHHQLNDLKKQYTMNQAKISSQKKLMQKAHFVQRLQRLERAVAQQQVHIMWQKKQLDQVATLENVMPALVHGTRPLWGPGSEEAAAESASGSSDGGLDDEKHNISHRLLKVEKVLNSIMAKNGEAEVGNHLGISELHP